MQLRICHKKPGCSFFWKGKQFHACTGCTGIYIRLLSLPDFFFFNNHIKHLVDFGINYPNIIGRLEISFFNTESNYTKRVTTGIFAGVGMMSLVAIVVEFLQIRIWRLIF